MIPLKTLPDATRQPFWTRVFALAIALIWLVQVGVLAFRGHNLALEWGVRPVCFFHPSGCGVAVASLSPPDFDSWPAWIGSPLIRLVVSPFTALWLHANWWHVAFNLLFLLVFGGAVEGDIGHSRFARLYLGGGLVATLCHIAFNGGSSVTTVGASGAIAAVLGAHCWRLPRAWVLTYFPPVFLLPVPSVLFGILWLALQMVGAWRDFHLPLSALSSGASVAWTAHVGGFAWGAWVGYRSPASYNGPVQLKHKFNRP